MRLGFFCHSGNCSPQTVTASECQWGTGTDVTVQQCWLTVLWPVTACKYPLRWCISWLEVTPSASVWPRTDTQFLILPGSVKVTSITHDLVIDCFTWNTNLLLPGDVSLFVQHLCMCSCCWSSRCMCHEGRLDLSSIETAVYVLLLQLLVACYVCHCAAASSLLCLPLCSC